MANPNEAFEVDEGIVIAGGTGVFSAPSLPSDTTLYPAGALMILPSGEQYTKTGSKWVKPSKSYIGIKKIPVGEVAVIPEGYESIIRRDLFVEGEIIIQGEVTIL